MFPYTIQASYCVANFWVNLIFFRTCERAIYSLSKWDFHDFDRWFVWDEIGHFIQKTNSDSKDENDMAQK